MTGKQRIGPRTFTALGLALLGVAILGVGLNVVWAGPGDGGVGDLLWDAARLLMAGVLIIGWALLNIPPPTLPSGQFICGLAELGETVATSTGQGSVQPAPRTVWDDFRASLPANLPIPTTLPTLRPRPAALLPPATLQTPRIPIPSLAAAAARAAGEQPDNDALELADPSAPAFRAQPATPDFVPPAVLPTPMPLDGRGATAWLVQKLNSRWASDQGLVADDLAFAPDAATARAHAAALHADVVGWGAMQPGPPPAFYVTVEIVADLERRAAPGDLELRLLGLDSCPLGPLSTNRPELLFAFLTGLAYYAARDFRAALNEWNTALIAARVDRDMQPPLDGAAEAVVQFYRGNAFYLDVAVLPADRRKETLLTAETAYLAAITADPALAAAYHNLALVYQAQGRLDKAAPALERALHLDPRLERARFSSGVLLLNLGHLDKAIRQFKSLAEDRPRDPEVQRALGRVYRADGKLDEAEAAAQAAVARNPGYAPATSDLAALYYERATPARQRLEPLDAELDRLLEARRRLQQQVLAATSGSQFATLENEIARTQQQIDRLEGQRGPLLRERQEWLDRARQHLARAVELRPNNPFDHANLAIVLRDMGEVDAAADEWAAAERLRPLGGASEYGLLYDRAGRLDRAHAPYVEATILRPASADTFINVGLALQREGHIAEATDQFIRVLYLDPASADANYRLGMVYIAQGQTDAAALHLQAALLSAHALPWPPADAVDALATIYRQREQYDRAQTLLQDQLARDPRDARAHYALGTIYRRQNKLDEAIAAFRAAIQYDPTLADAHYNLGVAYVASGRLEEARNEFRRIADIKPNDPDTHVLIGVALKDAGQHDAARAEFEQAVALDPDHVEAHYNLGLVYQSLGRPDAAIFAFRDVLRLDPSHPRVLNRLGMAYADRGRLDDAIAIFTRLVEDDPANAEAHYNLGIAYRATGNLPGVLAEFRAVVRLRPDDAEAYNTLGEACRTANEIEAAEAAFRRAIELGPAFPEPHYNLGRILTATNRTDAGVAAFRRYEELKDQDRTGAGARRG